MEDGFVLRPPISVRALAVGILAPSATFFTLVAVASTLQDLRNWPIALVELALAGVVSLIAVQTLRRGISAQNGILTIHGLRRNQIPLSTVAKIQMTPSRSYPGLLLLTFVRSDGKILGQLPPLWDLNAVASWAERVPIPFSRERAGKRLM
jgi:hypothetical protein